MKNKLIMISLLSILFSGCFPYIYYNRDKVLLKNVDIDQTLKIAEIELKSGAFGNILSLWAIRDQIITQKQAEAISILYFEYIDTLENEFGVWHLGWAISNMYREGDDSVKLALQKAYEDAQKRPEKLNQFASIADENINGDKIYMGDIHDLGKFYAKTHIVVPGNKDYLQSFEQYLADKEKKKNK